MKMSDTEIRRSLETAREIDEIREQQLIAMLAEDVKACLADADADATPVSPQLDYATVDAAYRDMCDFWLAERIAALPEHAKRLGGSWRLGWSDAVPLLWLPPEPTAEELAERERRGLEF